MYAVPLKYIYIYICIFMAVLAHFGSIKPMANYKEQLY